MNYIYNNIKGVIKALSVVSLLMSFASCSLGTDEELITASKDAERMNIRPTGYKFVFENKDTLDNKPDSMMVLLDRVIQSWRTGFVQSFKEDVDGLVYTGAGKYTNEEDSCLTVARYNLLGFTLDRQKFDYTYVYRFLNRESDSSIFEIPLSYNLKTMDYVMTPPRIICSTSNNFYISEKQSMGVAQIDSIGNIMNPKYVDMYGTKSLTQRYEWSFVVHVQNPDAKITSAMVYVNGVPTTLDLYSGVVDASNTCALAQICKITENVNDSNSFVVDSVRTSNVRVDVAIDATAVLAPKDADVLVSSGNNIGIMEIVMNVRDTAKGNTYSYKINHQMNELNNMDMYSISDDKKHITTVKDVVCQNDLYIEKKEGMEDLLHMIVVTKDYKLSSSDSWFKIAK